MTARKHTKCASCNDLLWFAATDQIGQHVVCGCGATTLHEDGAEGDPTDCTAEEVESMI